MYFILTSPFPVPSHGLRLLTPSECSPSTAANLPLSCPPRRDYITPLRLTRIPVAILQVNIMISSHNLEAGEMAVRRVDFGESRGVLVV